MLWFTFTFLSAICLCLCCQFDCDFNLKYYHNSGLNYLKKDATENLTQGTVCYVNHNCKGSEPQLKKPAFQFDSTKHTFQSFNDITQKVNANMKGNPKLEKMRENTKIDNILYVFGHEIKLAIKLL